MTLRKNLQTIVTLHNRQELEVLETCEVLRLLVKCTTVTLNTRQQPEYCGVLQLLVKCDFRV